MDTTEFLAPFDRMLEDHSTPAVVRQVEAGGGNAALWDAVEASGFLDALTHEAAGGAGLPLSAVGPLWEALGRHATPAPVGETMIARALLAAGGHEAPEGPIVLAPAKAPRTGPIPLALVARWALLETGGRLVLTALTDADVAASGAHNSLAASLSWSTEPYGLSIEAPVDGLRPFGAVLRAAIIAGAADRLLEMTVAYANDRIQFGRPIGKHQAVQHQLAVMAEQSVSARIAAQIGCASGFPPMLAAAAVAKQVASAAAAQVANIAHAVHGAIGISEEFDLQLFTRQLHQQRLADGSESYWAERLGEQRLASPQTSSLDLIREIA